MPAVQTPSMTPDINGEGGHPIQLSMRALAMLSDNGQTGAWQTLTSVAAQYNNWIERRLEEVANLPSHLRPVANRHLNAAASCLDRINRGIEILRSDERARKAFRLANLAMLLQQIATKQLTRRPLHWDQASGIVPEGDHNSPWRIFIQNAERTDLGYWRAFQIAFLLMSIDGVSNDNSEDREIVDLIWFPTGGGKTEAYLGVMAFYMFYQRLLMELGIAGPTRDGTNVLDRKSVV